MKMKKVLTIVLSLVMASCLLAGCGGGDDSKENPSGANTEAAGEPSEAAEEPSEEAEEPSEEAEEPSGAGDASGVNSAYVGEYLYEKNMGDGVIPWTLTLNEDGSFEICEKNEMMGTFTWTGDQWIDNGDGTVTTPNCVGSDTKMSGFWEGDANDMIIWAILNEGRAVPVKAEEYNDAVAEFGLFSGDGNAAAASASGDLAGEYTFVESTEFGEYTWTVTLNGDGSFTIVQDNPDMGNPTWTGNQWVDNGDGTVTTPDCQGDGAQLAPFWKDNGITFTVNGDGTVTPVE